MWPGCVRQGHTNAKYDADYDTTADDDDDVGGDDNDDDGGDGNNQILVQVQIETDHIQINSSVGRKGLDCRNIKKTKNCRNIEKTKMHQVNEMATRDRAGIYRFDHR